MGRHYLLTSLTFILLTCAVIPAANAQNPSLERQLLLKYQCGNQLTYYDGQHGNSSEWMMKKQRFTLKRMVSTPLTALMFTYQHVLSPQIPSNCRYATTCSNFSKHAFQEYRVPKAFFLTLDRLYRCNDNTHDHAPDWAKTKDGKTLDSACDYHFR